MKKPSDQPGEKRVQELRRLSEAEILERYNELRLLAESRSTTRIALDGAAEKLNSAIAANAGASHIRNLRDAVDDALASNRIAVAAVGALRRLA